LAAVSDPTYGLEAAAEPLTPLEVAYGLLLGRDPRAKALDRRPATNPRTALEEVLLEALRRPPCVISFSGGQDSSTLLAIAVSIARRENLPDPIPATLEFPSSAAADETAWQQLVLAHLGLRDWVRLPFTEELDAVGDIATGMLRRHGLVWPFNLHFHLPIIEAAAGGTVVTGFGGDELGRTSAGLYAERLLAERHLRRPRDAARIAYGLLPPRIKVGRERLRARQALADVPWLRPQGRRRLVAALARDYAAPFGWGRVLDWWWRSRYVQVCQENFRIVAAPYGVASVHPFADASVLAALAGSGNRAGLGGRGRLLEHLAGDVVPAEILARRTKATFSDPLFTATAREFARSWSGRGLDEHLVDPDVVRAVWLDTPSSAMATSMLQAAWLADNN
jgi:asparagine synthase (glutamine-hydrolysing)